jgi:hypothetical protein
MSSKPASVRIPEDSAARDGGDCRRNIAGERMPKVTALLA